jgi:tetratricopeptide (TPR) repeat protein
MAISAILVLSFAMLSGCTETDSGKAQLRAEQTKRSIDRSQVIQASQDKETDIIEQMSFHRTAYRTHLEALVKHYRSVGDYNKRQWAQNELEALDAMPQYNYIIEAYVAGPELRASEEIPDADDMYYLALVTEEQARKIPLMPNKEKLRIALDKYNQLIREYPTSDKIDDAAYKAAEIYEDFKDYSIAVLYYERASQWDPAGPYPARYRAAKILESKLLNRVSALEFYKQALEYESLTYSQREFAKQKVDELALGIKPEE